MKVLYVFLALVFIAVVILFFPFQVPDEGSTPEHQEPVTNLNESYPEHPKTLEDCKNTSKRDFCIGDAAEINNDINLCYEIHDPDIEVYCMARISSDETMCEEIIDDGLREACLESIHLKGTWSSS